MIAVLTNSLNGGVICGDLVRWLCEELVGVKMPKPLEFPKTPPKVNLARYTGTYEPMGMHLVVSEDGDGLVFQFQPTGVPEERQPPEPPPPVKYRPLDAERFGVGHAGISDVVVVQDFERGRPGYLLAGGRVARRLSGGRAAPAKRGRSSGAARWRGRT